MGRAAYLNPDYPDTMIDDLTFNWNYNGNITSQNYYDMAELEQVDSSDMKMGSNIELIINKISNNMI